MPLGSLQGFAFDLLRCAENASLLRNVARRTRHFYALLRATRWRSGGRALVSPARCVAVALGNAQETLTKMIGERWLYTLDYSGDCTERERKRGLENEGYLEK